MSNVIAMSSYHKHYKPEENSGICVVKRKGESFESLMKRFRKKFSKSGISKELRERMFHEKPSDKKRRKKAQAIRQKKRDEEKAAKMRERYRKMKAKQKRKREKEKEQQKAKGAKQNDQRTRRQNRGGISKTNNQRGRSFNSRQRSGSTRVRKSVVNG